MKLSPSLLALTSSAFCATTTSAFETQKLLRGAIVLASDSKYNNIPADTTVSENLVSIPNGFDPAYIHKDCSFPNYPGYCSDINTCTTGIGWYCNDGKSVNPNDPSEFDISYIRQGCHVGIQFSNQYNAWYCRDDYTYSIDRAYIKRGCDAKYVHYMTNADCENKWNTKCAQIGHLPGNEGAWYCGNEDVSSYDPSAFESAFITTGCNNGVHWDDNWKAWYCNNH